MPGDGNSCDNNVTLQPNGTCSIQFENVLSTNILALGASVGATYTENINVPTLTYQDATNSQVQFSAQPNLPTGGTIIYAQSNQATLANTVTVNEFGTAYESVTITHLLANSSGYTDVFVTTQMEDYAVADSGSYSPTCSSSSENGILTQTCTLSENMITGEGTYQVNQTLLNSVTDLNLTALFSTNVPNQGLVLSMNPIFATANLGTLEQIYFASNGLVGYDGNLLAQAQARAALPGQPAFTGTTGVAGADYLCNTDESKPTLPSGVQYKAMLAAENERQACPVGYYDTPCDTTAGNNIDWVMTPFTNYINTQNGLIGATNGAGVFTFNTTNFIALPRTGMTEGRAWSGIATVGWATSPGLACNNWTSSSAVDFGTPGLAGVDLGGWQISVDSIACDGKKYAEDSTNGLYCVQQP
jgi:hypothetical protein